MPAPLRSLVDALGEPATRGDAARALAHAMGAREFLLFTRDPDLGVFLPAPGMPQTVRGAASWQDLLDRCTGHRVSQEVDVGGERMHAVATVVGDCAFILAGDRHCEFAPELADALPLLAAAQRAQQALRLQSMAAAEAREAAAQAHRLARALEAARARAGEANRQLQLEHEHKDQFLAMLAHELRNPLAPISSALEILQRLKAPGGDARIDRQIDLIGRQLQQLTHLVDDLLDVSRVSRGLIELRRERLPLRDAIAAAIDSSRPLVDSRRHELRVDDVPQDIHVDADAVRLTQVFANLLNNAAKYTPPGGRIDVEVERREGEVQVRVRDNGLGIPREMLGIVFDLFTQVPGSLDRAPGGLGIGLTLVRRLVELHGGQVRADSAGPGTGSTFTVALPVVAAAAKQEAGPAGAAVTRAYGDVLVVDDNVDAAQSLWEVLGLLGMRATVARDGAEALAVAAAGPLPDVVLLDIGLPGMDGFEVAREWRRRFGRRTRLVALTGYGSTEDRRRTAQAGFDAHLVKPVVLDELLPFLDLGAHPPGSAP